MVVVNFCSRESDVSIEVSKLTENSDLPSQYLTGVNSSILSYLNTEKHFSLLYLVVRCSILAIWKECSCHLEVVGMTGKHTYSFSIESHDCSLSETWTRLGGLWNHLARKFL